MNNLPNLLIVDDLEANLDLLKVMIRKVRVNLIIAHSGAEALNLTSGLPLALALIDVRMPEMDGFELAVRINAERVDDKVPVIFLTALINNQEEIFKGYNSGAIDYITKPFNIPILLSKINVFLELFHQKQLLINKTEQLEETANLLSNVNSALKKSEEKYRSYIDYAPKGVFVADDTGRYLEVNKTMCTTTGFSEAELLNMRISDLIPEEYSKNSREFRSKVVSTGVLKAELPFRHKNGTKRWWTLSTVKFSQQRFLGFTEDITDRIIMEGNLHSYQIELEMQNEDLILAKQRAEDATKKYTELYDFAPTGYLTLSADLTIQELNHSAANMLGKERLLLIGNHFVFFVSRDSLNAFNSFFLKALSGKNKEIVDVMLETADNQSRYIHIEGRVVGNGQQFVINMVDLTERKRAEENLRQANGFLDSIVENIPHMIFIKDAELLRFIRFNKSGEDLLGIRKEEIVGKNDYDIFSKEEASRFIQKDREVLMNRKVLDITEEVIPTREHGIRVLHTKKVPILNESGDPEYLLGISEDITERKMVEHTLKISEEKYRMMVNNSPDGIILINNKGFIIEVSEIGQEIMGADAPKELLGKNFHRFIPGDEKNTLKGIFDKTTSDGICQNIQIKIKKINKPPFLSEISTTLIQADNGQSLAYMVIIRDISFRQKMEVMQIHADRMANLGEMASGMAHEINQPLNVISAVMDGILFEATLAEKIDIDHFKNKSEKIFQNILRIRNIIDHVRAFSRNQNDFVSTVFDINVSIENAVSMFEEQFRHQGINLSLNLDQQIPPFVGNTYQFEQVIINLLMNAKDAVIEKKFREGEHAERNIGITTLRESFNIIIEVSDNGTGISNDNLQNIMLPFYTTKGEGKGTGLGLSICYQIIEGMGGTIEINNNNSGGITVKIELYGKK